MKNRIPSAAVLLAAIAFGTDGAVPSHAGESGEPTVIITTINENETITGKVTGLQGPESFRIMVYVKTDQWYLHPFLAGGEGRSWGKIDASGNWEIQTVKRGFPADSVAVLIVDATTAENPESPITSLTRIPKRGYIVYSKKELEEKNWYGKL